MAVHSRKHAGQDQEELDVLMRRLPRVHEVDAVIRRERPVIVLAGAVDSVKRLLMQETDEAMAAGRLFQRLHHKLVMVHRNVCLIIDRGQLMLRGRDLIVLRLCGDAELPELDVHIPHKRGDPSADDAVVMVIELLALGRHGAEQRPPCIDEILAFQVLLPVDQEILLLRADRRLHGL